ncbi:MAG TPA: 3-hydroxyacyl-CoA dehydrogenase family protein [Gemmatimonadales bacterium]|nr:3-hydroxyacyl-CoA dehydrogenase family protein [Gemmatimonadales bacterium]
MTARTVAVLGAGVMGAGIAHACVTAGWATALHDADAAARDRGLARVRALLDGGVARGKLEPAAAVAAAGRLRPAASIREACRGADLVIEAVVEDADVKREVLAQASDWAATDALLATNTSALPVGGLAADLPRPGRLVGLHFFNPVHGMRLVEIVVHDAVDGETLAEARAVVAALGKEAIVVRDTPGFASSRLGIVLGLEAIRMLEQGVASAADIDQAMVLGYHHPVGPLRLTDLVGLDVRLRVADILLRELGGEQYRAPDLLRRLVAEGRLGRKTGEGFYHWDE